MQLGTEDKKVSLHRLIIVFLIAFIALVIALVIIYLNEQQKITDEMNQIQKPEASQTSNNQGTTGSQKLSKTQKLNESEIKQIKMDIITGKREDVPLGTGEDKSAIINEYLSGCDMIADVPERIACFELYYVNNDASLKVEEQNCEKLSNVEKTKCLDNLYFTLATQEQSFFCYAITDEALRNQCLDIG
jgi:hypothetical protein